jgi:DNA-directed RNA polymerase subunit RPC12/RpoP
MSNEPQATPALPSLYLLKCPYCGSSELQVVGTKGSTGKALATTIAFGAIGNLVAGANAAGDLTTSEIQYKCASCKKKFDSWPLDATPEEYLPAPCTIHFERVGSFVGMAVPQIVYLNGAKIGPVKNGQTVDFLTYLKYNTIFVTDQHGLAFKGSHRFEALPGGNIPVRFNRKFL